MNHEIYKSINTLAEFLGKEPKEIIGSIAFLDKEVFKKIVNEYNSTISFYEKPLEERAKLMGYDVKKRGDVTEISTVL